MRVNSRVIMQIVNQTAPLSGEIRGVRIQFAHPNMAGRVPFTKKPGPSFRKPYFIAEYYGEGDADNPRKEDVERALRLMHEQRYYLHVQ